jgi:hypothetical protein
MGTPKTTKPPMNRTKEWAYYRENYALTHNPPNQSSTSFSDAYAKLKLLTPKKPVKVEVEGRTFTVRQNARDLTIETGNHIEIDVNTKLNAITMLDGLRFTERGCDFKDVRMRGKSLNEEQAFNLLDGLPTKRYQLRGKRAIRRFIFKKEFLANRILNLQKGQKLTRMLANKRSVTLRLDKAGLVAETDAGMRLIFTAFEPERLLMSNWLEAREIASHLATMLNLKTAFKSPLEVALEHHDFECSVKGANGRFIHLKDADLNTQLLAEAFALGVPPNVVPLMR